MKHAVICKNLTRRFGEQRALKQVNLALPKKGMIGILGHSGSGKSTLLNILAMLDDGYKGEVRILNVNPARLNEKDRGAFRLQNIGYVFQSFELLELESALRNVLVPLDSSIHASNAQKRKKAADLLRFVGMKGFEHQRVATLSGGQKQRVAIARALANDPRIILADEPSGCLDERNADMIFDLLKRISKNALVIVVSHDETLARQYCDEGYFFKDGSCVAHEIFESAQAENPPTSMWLPKKEGATKPSFGFHLSHAWKHFTTKKYRSLVSEIAIALGLVGVGLSTFMTSTIKEELSGAFSSIVPENVITMSSPSTGGQSVSNVYAARKEEATYLYEQYPEYIKGIGSSVQIGYEAWFTDANLFTFLSGPTQAVLPGFSSRTINDYLWLEDYPSLTFFPNRPKQCDGDDEVILGLPYSSMSNLCYGLHIPRNFQSLGDFVGRRKLQLMLTIARYEWEFEDVELFTVIGVAQTEFPCFFHSSHDWNSRFFLDHLKFRSWLNEETPDPQYALELPFLSLRGNAEELLPLLRKDESLNHLVFELASPDLLPSVCPIGKKCGVNRLYLYGADKLGCSWTDLDNIAMKFPKIIGRTPVTQGAYYADASSVAMGFAGKFFLCESEEKAKNVIDLYSDLPKENAGLQLETPQGTIDGSYLSSASNGLRLSCDLTGIDGSPPSGLEEVALSRPLYDELGQPKEIFLAAETKAEEIGDTVSRQFQVARLKVSGVKEGKNRVMHVVSDWAVDFFQIHMGMNAFLLQPNGCVFYLEEGANALVIVDELRKYYPSYRFGSPQDDVKDSMSSTLSYLGTVLAIFSFISLVMSSLLLFVVLSIQMNESRREDEMFFVLGISRNDIAKGYVCHCALYTTIGILIASVILLIAQVFARSYIARSFGGSSSGMISLRPILTMAAVGFVLGLIISIILYFSLLKTDFSKKESKY